MPAQSPDDGGRVVPLRPPSACRLAEWKPAAGDSALLGRATVAFQGGWVVAFIPIFRAADGALSASSPSMPILDQSGQHLRDAASGKKRYTSIISFESADARARWNSAILAALSAGGIT